jgi:hypothetical protein
LKEDPMEVSRKLLYRSKNEDDEVGDLRYSIVKTLLENGVKVKFHNNALSFDGAITEARLKAMRETIKTLGLTASNIELLAGTDDWKGTPESKAFYEELMRQWRKAAQS